MARRLRDEIGITRPILLDGWEGTLHNGYGAMPNMTWVLGRGGTVIHKAEWTSSMRIAEFLERYRARPPAGPSNAPFYTEQLELQPRDRAVFQQGLERNGPRAVAEFARAEEIWAERGRARRMERLKPQ